MKNMSRIVNLVAKGKRITASEEKQNTCGVDAKGIISPASFNGDRYVHVWNCDGLIIGVPVRSLHSRLSGKSFEIFNARAGGRTIETINCGGDKW